MGKIVLFTDRQAQRIEGAVRAVERDQEQRRPNPHPSYLASPLISAVISRQPQQFATNRYLYLCVRGRWDSEQRTIVAITPPGGGSGGLDPGQPAEELLTCFNENELGNSPTQTGTGIPLGSDGQGTVTLKPLPRGLPVQLRALGTNAQGVSEYLIIGKPNALQVVCAA